MVYGYCAAGMRHLLLGISLYIIWCTLMQSSESLGHTLLHVTEDGLLLVGQPAYVQPPLCQRLVHPGDFRVVYGQPEAVGGDGGGMATMRVSSTRMTGNRGSRRVEEISTCPGRACSFILRKKSLESSRALMKSFPV